MLKVKRKYSLLTYRSVCKLIHEVKISQSSAFITDSHRSEANTFIFQVYRQLEPLAYVHPDKF